MTTYVETDRNQEAHSAVEQHSDDDGQKHDDEEEKPETPVKAEHQVGNFGYDTSPQAGTHKVDVTPMKIMTLMEKQLR